VHVAERLIFIYNADSGLFNTLSDMAHKLLFPQSYSCRLCALTHGVFNMRHQWCAFLSELDYELEFLHRDEFSARYPGQEFDLPAILKKGKNGLEMVISAQELQPLSSLDQLQTLLLKKLS
jgi:hypothetical protein